MKIAHVVWGMKTGGVETMLVNIINEQVKTEEVRLFIINDFVNESILNEVTPKCIIKRLNRRPGSRNFFKILKLNKWVYSYSPDIIHVHSFRVSRLIWGKWNIVRTIHGMNNFPDEYPRMKGLYAISNAVADFTRKQGFSNVKVVSNGITAEKFKTKISACNDGMFHIVQVSRLYMKDKGQDVLLRALRKLVHIDLKTNIKLHFIGEGRDLNALQDMVNNYKISDYVCFEGNKSQDYLRQHLCDYDIFVQPSFYEGFALTVAEAMAAGVPVLVSDIPAPMEVIDSGKAGMSFKVGNSDDLAEKLKIIIQRGYPESYLQAAHHRAMNLYNVHHTAQMYIEEYKKVIAAR